MERFILNINMDNNLEVIINHNDEIHILIFANKTMKKIWFQYICNDNAYYENDKFYQNGNFSDWIEEVIKTYKDSYSFKLTSVNSNLYFYFPNQSEANNFINEHIKFEVSAY